MTPKTSPDLPWKVSRAHFLIHAIAMSDLPERRRPGGAAHRTLLAWPTVSRVLYGVFGLMTLGIGVIFCCLPREVLHYGFGFLGRNIGIVGYPVAFVGLVQIVTTPLPNFPVRLSIAALSVSFYASISTQSASPTGAWIYGCIGLCHVLICSPRER